MATQLLPRLGPPFRRPLPPSRKVKYNKAMTVCIAAVCQEEGEPRIVLCSDTRFTWGGITSSDVNPKMDVIGKGWVAQFAGRPDSAKELTVRLKEWFAKTRLNSSHSILMTAKAALDEFKSSPLYEKECCEVLMSGFCGDGPMLVLLAPAKSGHLSVTMPSGFASIGIGNTISNVLLTCREYNSTARIEDATYFVYEAKRFSEKASDVGRITSMWWQAPTPSDIDHERAMLLMVNSVGLDVLEEMFQSNGLRIPIRVESFPKECFGEMEEARNFKISVKSKFSKL